MEFKIRLNSIEEAVKLVNTLDHHDYHADAMIESYVINARSLLGILGYGIGRDIRVLFHKVPDEYVGALMSEFTAA